MATLRTAIEQHRLTDIAKHAAQLAAGGDLAPWSGPATP
jgi:hypothetical protein